MKSIYQGSVKNVLGPFEFSGSPTVLFEFSDAFSVFDWGKMPDKLENKGKALCLLAADLFEVFEDPQTWKEFSRTPVALSLRKSNPLGITFNEIGEKLKSEGLRTHYRGLAKMGNMNEAPDIGCLSEMQEATRRLAVKQVYVHPPEYHSVCGRAVPFYSEQSLVNQNRLIPLEFVFRFGAPSGSSILARSQYPDVCTDLERFQIQVSKGHYWDFPYIEVFSKLEPTDRSLGVSEALAISKVTPQELNQAMVQTTWIAGLLKSLFGQLDMKLADGKLEWGVGPDGVFLVDAIGLDELRLLDGEVQFSKEFLRKFYRDTSWYQSLSDAKAQASKLGTQDWKKFVSESPPELPESVRELATQIYMSLCNEVTHRRWFDSAWPLSKLRPKLREFYEGGLR